MLAPHTPARAKTSVLLSRTAPKIPSASELYEPLVKRVLRHRQFKVFLHSALFSWFLVTTWTTWQEGKGGSITAPIRVSTLLYSVAAFVAGALPVVVVRKAHLAASPTPATSPSKILTGAFKKSSTIHAFAVYTASAIFLATIHIMITGAYEPSVDTHARLSIFVKSKKHPYYLNGHLIYVLLSQAFVAFACLLRSVLLDRFTVRWNFASSQEQLKTFGLARILTVTFTTLIYTALVSLAYIVAFGLARATVLPVLFQLPVLSNLLRPFAAHFLRGQWAPFLLTRHWSLVTRTFYLALSTVGVWEFAETSFEAIVAEPTHVAAQTADQGLTLVSGITSTDPYLKHFAFAELRDLATDPSEAASARRTALFGDQKYTPSLWATLSREALLTLGRDYQLFLRRGQPAPPAPAAAAPPKASTPLPAPATPLLRASVFRAPQPSPLRAALDTFASDGALAAAVDETAGAGVAHVPELFRSVVAAPSSPLPAVAAGAKEAERAVVAAGSAWWARVERAVGGDGAEAGRARRWWARERVHKVAEASLPDRHLDALVAEVLCRLACASLAEDRYGVVQRDIPRIVEALLAFLGALEEYRAELGAKHARPDAEALKDLPAREVAEREVLAMEAARASEVVGVVEDAIKEGVVQIVRTFGEKLAAFKFPPRTAKKLQGFVDYN
ncbi:nucleoporin protein Ndc1-Nup [Epithele typhae]|uniref:nucleoporin protein Ndc1-Nup n=1 Tax=Epithele typhae TaxID=378194 RepID=UPI002007BBDA|nr:nucleoporin protein Ndc1-Nup [Epithele typhae]KAH9915454.1 nucleoporin protein Ndc1-Nup [Epithele typhae]